MLGMFYSILVVFLHTVNIGRPYANILLESIPTVIHKIVWMINPVEFFFLSSSYFIVPSVERDKKRLKRYIKRLTILYLFWSIFYIKNYINYFFIENSGDIKLFATACLKVFRRFFCLERRGICGICSL